MAIVFYKRICIVLYKLVYFKNNIILGIFLNDVKGCGGALSGEGNVAYPKI